MNVFIRIIITLQTFKKDPFLFYGKRSFFYNRLLFASCKRVFRHKRHFGFIGNYFRTPEGVLQILLREFKRLTCLFSIPNKQLYRRKTLFENPNREYRRRKALFKNLNREYRRWKPLFKNPNREYHDKDRLFENKNSVYYDEDYLSENENRIHYDKDCLSEDENRVHYDQGYLFENEKRICYSGKSRDKTIYLYFFSFYCIFFFLIL